MVYFNKITLLFYFPGLYDIAVEGEWTWVQDCLTPSTWQIFNWAPGNPDDIAGYRDCAELTPAGQWDDVLCSKENPYVCEIMTKSKFCNLGINIVH